MSRLTTTVVDLDLALRMCGAARTRAEQLDAQVSVAVVNGGGHLVAFTRMDGAEIAGPVLARDKAYTAVAHRCPTDELSAQVAPGGPLAGMHPRTAGGTSASAAASRSGRRAASSAASGSAVARSTRTASAPGRLRRCSTRTTMAPEQGW